MRKKSNISEDEARHIVSGKQQQNTSLNTPKCQWTKSAHNLLRKPRDTSTDPASSFVSGGQFHIDDATGAAATSARTRPAKPAKRAKVQMERDRSASAKRLYRYLDPSFKEQLAHRRNAAFEEVRRGSSFAPVPVAETLLSAGAEEAIQKAGDKNEVIDDLMTGRASFPDTPLPDDPIIEDATIHTTPASVFE